jgi:hypothetical protein
MFVTMRESAPRAGTFGGESALCSDPRGSAGRLAGSRKHTLFAGSPHYAQCGHIVRKGNDLNTSCQALQKDLGRLSSNSTHLITTRTGYAIMFG